MCKTNIPTLYNWGHDCQQQPTLDLSYNLILNNNTNNNIEYLNTIIHFIFNYTGSPYNQINLYATSPSFAPFTTVLIATIPVENYQNQQIVYDFLFL